MRSHCWGLVLLLGALTFACRTPGDSGPSRERVAPPPGASSGPTGSAPVLGPLDTDGSGGHLPPARSAEPPFTVVFHYDDFGPDSMARELLGPQWWSWAHACCFDPDDEFDIRVVVYRDRELADVRAQYPTVEEEADYRYVERDAALRHLDDAISYLARDRDDEWPYQWALRQRLEKTRAAILSHLGDGERR